MKLRSTGKIADRFYVLGSLDVPVFLLDGPHPALFDAGFRAFAGMYQRDIENILCGRAPEYLFLTHAHYDHIGAVSRFKEAWPRLKVVAHAKTAKILASQGALRAISDLSREAANLGGKFGVVEIDEHGFEPFTTDLMLSPSQMIPLEPDLTITALPTPGHTQDAVSYWIPQMKILIASDAVGNEDERGYITSEFLVDFDAFCASLQMISQLNAEILCPGHRLVVTGASEVRSYLGRCIEEAVRHLAMVEDFLEREGDDISRTVARIKAFEWDPVPWPKQPEKAYLINTRAKVRTILERKHMRR
jgi:glyoxylase-like metal-dependent hydrolase (beta-lactamase superfamily II)